MARNTKLPYFATHDLQKMMTTRVSIEVFCRRQLRIVHRHPDIHMVNKHAADRPHLAQDHEHSVVVTVTAKCPADNRVIDLLDLQAIMGTLKPVMYMDASSFEQMCRFFFFLFEDRHNICRVTVEADGVEGATLEWEAV